MIIVRGDVIMYRTLDGTEWVKPIVSVPLNLDGRERVYGKDAFIIVNEINNYFQENNFKIKYKSVIVQTDKGIFKVYTNFVKGCPIFLPIKDNEPIITQFLSPDGFRPDIQAPPNILEILSQYTKYEEGIQ